MQPESYSIHRWIARCYRNLGEYNDAEEHLELAIEDNPLSPKNNYEAGLLFMATEDYEKALECFQKANNIWIDADENYEAAQDVKRLIIELSACLVLLKFIFTQISESLLVTGFDPITL